MTKLLHQIRASGPHQTSDCPTRRQWRPDVLLRPCLGRYKSQPIPNCIWTSSSVPSLSVRLGLACISGITFNSDLAIPVYSPRIQCCSIAFKYLVGEPMWVRVEYLYISKCGAPLTQSRRRLLGAYFATAALPAPRYRGGGKAHIRSPWSQRHYISFFHHCMSQHVRRYRCGSKC